MISYYMQFKNCFKFRYFDHTVCYHSIVALCHDMHTKTYWRVQSPLDYTYILWMPAFLTADDTALTAVWIKLMSCEKSPVAEGCFFCSANINLVRVTGSVSMGLAPLILFSSQWNSTDVNDNVRDYVLSPNLNKPLNPSTTIWPRP